MIYAGLLVFVFGMWCVSEGKKLNIKYFIFFSFFLMTLVVGLRGNTVGEDTESYLFIAKCASEISWWDIIKDFPMSAYQYISYGIYGGYTSRIETVFLLYNKIIMMLFGDGQAVLFVTAVLTHIGFARFILDNNNRRENIYFGTIVFLCESLFFSEFNMMRQMLAMSIALQSFKHISAGHLKKSLKWIAIAWLFHQSSLVYLALIPLSLYKNKRKEFKYVIVAASIIPFSVPILSMFISRFLPSKYLSYLQGNIWSGSIGGTALIWALIIVLICVAFKCGIKKDCDYLVVYCLIIYLAIEMLAMNLTTIGRVAAYFRAFEILFFPMVSRYFKGKNRKIYVGTLIGLLTLSFISYANSPARVYTFF